MMLTLSKYAFYQDKKEPLGVSDTLVYNKINDIEPNIRDLRESKLPAKKLPKLMADS